MKPKIELAVASRGPFGFENDTPGPSLADGMLYESSVATDVTRTWIKFGYKPTTKAERDRRNAKHKVAE